MGTLNLDTETYHRRKITDALKRRGLVLDTEEDWEIHGPHEGMNFQVYVGYVTSKNDPNDCFCVSVAMRGPGRGIYEIDDPSCWGQVIPENKIPCID